MLKIFELLGNGASQVLQLYLPFPCFPKYYLECGPPIGTWTLVSLFKMKKNHLMKMQEIQLRSQRCFIFLCNVGRMEGTNKILEAGTGSWSYVTYPCAKCVSPWMTLPLWFPGWEQLTRFCHPSLCKMCVTSDDPALVVPWMGPVDLMFGCLICLKTAVENEMGNYLHPSLPKFFKK